MWRSGRSPEPLNDPAISSDDADPENDSFRNLTEYALGLEPLILEPNATQSGWDAEGHLTLTYRQRRGATDVTTLAEGSANLSAWSSATSVVQEIARDPQGDFDQVTVRLVPPGPVTGFLRVRVTRPSVP